MTVEALGINVREVQGPRLNITPRMGVPMINIRQSRDHPIFNMGGPYTDLTTYLYSDSPMVPLEKIKLTKLLRNDKTWYKAIICGGFCKCIPWIQFTHSLILS